MSEGFVIEKKVLKKYEGPGGAVVIPEGVEEIGFQAFKDQRGVMSVEFPKSLKCLRKEAFAGCVGLSAVVLTEGLTNVGAFAFAGCAALTSVSLPESVFKISDSAFKDCPELKDINIPKGLQSIGRYAFRNCAVLPDLDLPEGLLEIGKYAFEGCKAMEALTIPASVQKLGEVIVFKSGIKTVTLLGNVKHPEEYAFQWYSGKLSAIHTPVSRFCSDSKLQLVQSFAEAYCDGAELDPAVKDDYIGYIRKRRKDFYDMALKTRHLMILMVREKIIPREQFQEVFDKCSKSGDAELTALLLEYRNQNFPPLDPVKEAEKSFKAIEREEKAQETYQETGYMTAAMAKPFWKYSTRKDKKTLLLEKYKGREDEVVTPKGIAKKEVREIGEYAFTYSTAKRITISEGVQVIHRYAFSWCRQLTGVSLPDSVTELKAHVFVDCKQLASVTLPKKLTEISESLFSCCTSLKEIVIPDKVKIIRYQAFINCENLESVTIPASVKEIYKWAFRGCPRLTIRAPAGSYAEAFAKEHNIPFDTL